MKLIKRTPAYPAFDSLFNDFFGRSFFDDDRFTYRVPAVNVKENEEGFHLELVIPGLKKEDVKVHLDDRTLTISSEVSSENKEADENGRYTRREFGFRSFKRAFTLPESVNTESIDAKFENGILYVSLPKLAEVQKANKLIEIS